MTGTGPSWMTDPPAVPPPALAMIADAGQRETQRHHARVVAGNQHRLPAPVLVSDGIINEVPVDGAPVLRANGAADEMDHSAESLSGQDPASLVNRPPQAHFRFARGLLADPMLVRSGSTPDLRHLASNVCPCNESGLGHRFGAAQHLSRLLLNEDVTDRPSRPD